MESQEEPANDPAAAVEWAKAHLVKWMGIQLLDPSPVTSRQVNYWRDVHTHMVELYNANKKV